MARNLPRLLTLFPLCRVHPNSTLTIVCPVFSSLIILSTTPVLFASIASGLVPDAITLLPILYSLAPFNNTAWYMRIPCHTRLPKRTGKYTLTKLDERE